MVDNSLSPRLHSLKKPSIVGQLTLRFAAGGGPRGGTGRWKVQTSKYFEFEPIKKNMYPLEKFI